MLRADSPRLLEHPLQFGCRPYRARVAAQEPVIDPARGYLRQGVPRDTDLAQSPRYPELGEDPLQRPHDGRDGRLVVSGTNAQRRGQLHQPRLRRVGVEPEAMGKHDHLRYGVLPLVAWSDGVTKNGGDTG